MSAYKVVARHKSIEEQPSWQMCKKKQGTQAKKTAYVSKADFDKYSPELIERWEEIYDVSVWKMVDDKWEEI